jgi:hypothetical protein
MVTNSRYATAQIQLYQVLVHHHLIPYRRNATSGYSRHPPRLPKARKWVYKAVAGTNTLVLEYSQISPAFIYISEIVIKGRVENTPYEIDQRQNVGGTESLVQLEIC